MRRPVHLLCAAMCLGAAALPARVKVGGQTIRFDGKRVVFGE